MEGIHFGGYSWQKIMESGVTVTILDMGVKLESEDILISGVLSTPTVSAVRSKYY